MEDNKELVNRQEQALIGKDAAALSVLTNAVAIADTVVNKTYLEQLNP